MHELMNAQRFNGDVFFVLIETDLIALGGNVKYRDCTLRYPDVFTHYTAMKRVRLVNSDTLLNPKCFLTY